MRGNCQILKLHSLLFCYVLFRLHSTDPSWRVFVCLAISQNTSRFTSFTYGFWWHENSRVPSVIVILRSCFWLSCFVRTIWMGRTTYAFAFLHKWKMAIWHKANTPKVSIDFFSSFSKQQKNNFNSKCHIFGNCLTWSAHLLWMCRIQTLLFKVMPCIETTIMHL